MNNRFFNFFAVIFLLGFLLTACDEGDNNNDDSPPNNPPIADNQSINTAVDTDIVITLSGSDADGDALTYAVVGDPSHGSLSGDAPNLTYTPEVNYTGSDSFTYSVSDGEATSTEATVTITITEDTPENNPPIADNQSINTAVDTDIVITLSGSDADGDALTYAVVSDPSHGSLSGDAPTLTYTPEVNYTGSDSFTYSVSDGEATSAEATITITITEDTPENNPPTASDLNVSTSPDTGLAITLTGNDIDGDPLTYTLTGTPSHGSLSGDAPNLTYTPEVNYTGSDSFTFSVSDGETTSGEATVTINITSSDVFPIAYDQKAYLELDTKLPIRLTGKDPEGASLSFEVVSAPNSGTLLGAPPELYYVLKEATFSGNDTFSFRTYNGKNWSETATVDIQVRFNSVESSQIGGPTDGLYLHVPNHLVYQDIGPHSFDLTLNRTEDPLDSTIRRVEFHGKTLLVNLGSSVLEPPFTVSLKWIPDSANSNGKLLESGPFTLHENNGVVKTEVSGTGVTSNHSEVTNTESCNQAVVVVEANRVTTYVNGVSTSVSVSGTQNLADTMQLGPYDGRLWDLRVYDHAMDQAEVDDVSQDSMDITSTPFEDFPLYRCGVYVCEWYSGDDELTEEDLNTYLADQDWFYEHNLFTVGMHPFGDIGGYFKAGRPGWNDGAKWRDMKLDERWIEYARMRDRFNNGYWVHEDFHQYQGVLGDYLGKGWNYFMAEATAEWAPVEYTPEISGLYILGEYIFDSHFPMWMGAYDDQTGYSTIRIDDINQGGHPYGTYVFFSYLTREVLSSKAIGDIYNHPDDPRAPIEAVYKLLADAGVDMRDMFVEFAARTVTYDYKHGLTEAFRANEALSLSSIQNNINPDITEDSKFVTLYDAQGSGTQWASPPSGKRPGSWGYNLYKVEKAQGTYKLAVQANADNPSHAEFRAMVLLYDADTDTRSYFNLPPETMEEGIEVEAAGEDLILVVASTPSQRFEGFEQYNYNYRMQKQENDNKAIPVFLLAGQSNMEGHVDDDFFNGILSDIADGPDNTLKERLEDRINTWYEEYDNGYAQYAASEEVSALEAEEIVRLHISGLVDEQLTSQRSDVWCSFNNPEIAPLDTGFGFPFGPELTLGHHLGDDYDSSISLIKVALGGSTLHTDWLSPTSAAASGKTTGPQYILLSERISSLDSAPESIHPDCADGGCEWSAFIWFQGENDSLSEDGAANYKQNLLDFIADVRAEAGLPTLPVVIVEIGYWAQTLSYGDLVRQAQEDVAKEDPYIALVTTDDLSRFYHYDPPSQLIIGERIGKAIDSLLP